MTDIRDVLLRLKRKMGKERARERRMYNDELAKNPSGWSANRDRSWYQMNIWGLAMGMLDKELERFPSLQPKAGKRAQPSEKTGLARAHEMVEELERHGFMMQARPDPGEKRVKELTREVTEFLSRRSRKSHKRKQEA